MDASGSQASLDIKRKREEKNKKRRLKKKAKIAKAYGLGSRKNISLASTHASNSRKHGKIDKKSSSLSLSSPKLERIFSDETDLKSAGNKVLEWMISPIECRNFFRDYYQQKPLLVRRTDTKFYSGLISSVEIRQLLKKGSLNHSKDFTLTCFQNGFRSTMLKEADHVANEVEVMKLFENNKCSLRMLRPHNHFNCLWKLIACLEGFWGCGCGSNVYWTPKGSQGFAPHYDDIDAFVLQIEGKKAWTVYDHFDSEASRRKREGEEDDEEELQDLFPRHPLSSSDDFQKNQVQKLGIAVETTLGPGDFLYIPRGMVHEAQALEDEDSLHITISSSQHHSWADLVALALTQAVDRTCKSDLDHESKNMRMNLPTDIDEYMGVRYSDRDGDARREKLGEKVIKYISENVLPRIDLDIVVDQIKARFQYDRHKPLGVLSRLASSDTSVDVVDPEDVSPSDDVSLESSIVLAAKGIATLTIEGDAAVLYHSCQNTTTYHETDQRGIEFEREDAELIEQILDLDPSDPVSISSLKHPIGNEDLLRVVSFLVSEKVVMLVD